MRVQILGCFAGAPRSSMTSSAQLLEIKGHLFLIDCGEATQFQLRKAGAKFSRIKHIFISHLHGDHYFGLVGLISTFNLLGRTAELCIYGPKGIKDIILLQFKLGKAHLGFPLHFVELDEKNSVLLFEDDAVVVKTLPLRHRIYCNGFLFQAKAGERILNLQKALELGIDTAYFNKLKQACDVPNQKGEIIDFKTVTKDPPLPKSYAYCSDTIYDPNLPNAIQGVTALYHEATFLDELSEIAKKTMHTTAKQAAQIALKASAKHLLLGHFSTRYKTTEAFCEEARQVFPNTQICKPLDVFEF
ncbi:MAG: ribonuclease Z [Flavobacteriaceae bacterium]|nr:ribonuclease Z [Flavobacteriaceae bacterium]